MHKKHNSAIQLLSRALRFTTSLGDLLPFDLTVTPVVVVYVYTSFCN